MKKAIGIVRVSQVAGREGESFASPLEQRERIAAACERDGLELVATIDEMDVSGGTPLSQREGLREAVEGIEAGRAEVLIAAYFDRLVRSLRVQGEVVERVENAGGKVLALDFGAVTGKTAAQWLSGTVFGAFAEYYRRSAGERIGEAQARAIARGVPTFDNYPPGYSRGESGVLAPDANASTARTAFAMRAGGATIKEVRAFLAKQGIKRSYHGVQSMLSSRIYLGELHFGKLSNLEAHEPIIDRDLFERVQRARQVRGRRGKSDRLLARLGVLRCGECGTRMTVGHQRHNGRDYPFYRCSPVGDCQNRQTISARIAEGVVIEAVKKALAELEGRASADDDARAAELEAERAQAELDAAIRAFSGLEAEPAAVERLRELRNARDKTRARADHLRGLRSSLVVSVADWEHLSLDAKRAIIRAYIAGAIVRPGKGAGRITVVPLRE